MQAIIIKNKKDKGKEEKGVFNARGDFFPLSGALGSVSQLPSLLPLSVMLPGCDGCGECCGLLSGLGSWQNSDCASLVLCLNCIVRLET